MSKSVVLPAYVIYIAISFFVYPVSDVVSVYGCYAIDIIGIYQVNLFGSSSFYTALFRYLCIVHQNHLMYFGISPQVSTYCRAAGF